MYEEKYTIRQIAEKEGVPVGSITGIVKRCTKQKSGRDQSRPGRPTILTDRDKRHILRLIENDPFIQNQQILDQISSSISTGTLTAYLKSVGRLRSMALTTSKDTKLNSISTIEPRSNGRHEDRVVGKPEDLALPI